MKDIPKYYIPLTPNDLPHRPSRQLVLEKLEKTKKLNTIFKTPNEPIIHPGLEPPIRCDDPSLEKLFPEYLNYSVCIKNIADRLKYQGIFFNQVDSNIELQDTITDLIEQKFIINSTNDEEIEKATQFIKLYDFVRFSGQEIQRTQFIEFVQLCIYFVDLTANQNEFLLDNNRNTTNVFDQSSLFGIANRDTDSTPIFTNPFNNSRYFSRSNTLDYENSINNYIPNPLAHARTNMTTGHSIVSSAADVVTFRPNSNHSIRNNQDFDDNDIQDFARPPRIFVAADRNSDSNSSSSSLTVAQLSSQQNSLSTTSLPNSQTASFSTVIHR